MTRSRAKSLLRAYDGPMGAVVLATGPAFSDDVPATLEAQLKIEETEIRAETRWTAELAGQVRAGKLSLETVIDVVALYVARRVRHQQARERKRTGYGW
jgi:hypothetical protein